MDQLKYAPVHTNCYLLETITVLCFYFKERLSIQAFKVTKLCGYHMASSKFTTHVSYHRLMESHQELLDPALT